MKKTIIIIVIILVIILAAAVIIKKGQPGNQTTGTGNKTGTEIQKNGNNSRTGVTKEDLDVLGNKINSINVENLDAITK